MLRGPPAHEDYISCCFFTTLRRCCETRHRGSQTVSHYNSWPITLFERRWLWRQACETETQSPKQWRGVTLIQLPAAQCMNEEKMTQLQQAHGGELWKGGRDPGRNEDVAFLKLSRSTAVLWGCGERDFRFPPPTFDDFYSEIWNFKMHPVDLNFSLFKYPRGRH